MELDFNNELDIDLSEYENLYNKLTLGGMKAKIDIMKPVCAK